MFYASTGIDRLRNLVRSTWWTYPVVGINLVLLAVLIMLFPELLAYLVAGFLLITGLIMMTIAFKHRSEYGRHHRRTNSYWIKF